MRFYCERGDLTKGEVNDILIRWCEKFGCHLLEGYEGYVGAERFPHRYQGTYNLFGVDSDDDTVICDFPKHGCRILSPQEVQDILEYPPPDTLPSKEPTYLEFVREQLGIGWPHIVEQINSKWERQKEESS